MMKTFNFKRGITAILVVTLAYFLMDMVVHHLILGKMYQETMSLWRPLPEIMAKRWVAFLGYPFFGILFVAFFWVGFDAEKYPLGQGVRYGCLMGVFYWGSHLLINYPFDPVPDKLYLAWFSFGVIEFVLLGFLAGLLVRSKK